jgi:hypothetical protein
MYIHIYYTSNYLLFLEKEAKSVALRGIYTALKRSIGVCCSSFSRKRSKKRSPAIEVYILSKGQLVYDLLLFPEKEAKSVALRGIYMILKGQLVCDGLFPEKEAKSVRPMYFPKVN